MAVIGMVGLVSRLLTFYKCISFAMESAVREMIRNIISMNTLPLTWARQVYIDQEGQPDPSEL